MATQLMTMTAERVRRAAKVDGRTSEAEIQDRRRRRVRKPGARRTPDGVARDAPALGNGTDLSFEQY